MKLKEVVDEKVKNFLLSRKGKGKEYTNRIISILLEQRRTVPEGWVRPKEFKDICCAQTLFRLLKDLESSHIIERTEGKDRDVYYRIPAVYSSIYFLSREELIDHIKENFSTIIELNEKLTGVKEYLKKHGVSHPDAEIEAWRQSWKQDQELNYKRGINEGIKNGTAIIKPRSISPDTHIATNRFL